MVKNHLYINDYELSDSYVEPSERSSKNVLN